MNVPSPLSVILKSLTLLPAPAGGVQATLAVPISISICRSAALSWEKTAGSTPSGMRSLSSSVMLSETDTSCGLELCSRKPELLPLLEWPEHELIVPANRPRSTSAISALNKPLTVHPGISVTQVYRKFRPFSTSPSTSSVHRLGPPQPLPGGVITPAS